MLCSIFWVLFPGCSVAHFNDYRSRWFSSLVWLNVAQIRFTVSISTSCHRFSFGRFNRLLATAQFARYRFLREIMYSIGDAWPIRIVRFRCCLIRFRVVFGAGTAASYDCRRIFVDSNWRSWAQRWFSFALQIPFKAVFIVMNGPITRRWIEIGSIIVGCGAQQRLGTSIDWNIVCVVQWWVAVARLVVVGEATAAAAHISTAAIHVIAITIPIVTGVLVNFGQIALTTTHQIDNRRTTQLRFFFVQMWIRAVQCPMANISI